MGFPQISFVDAPSPSAATRLVLDNGDDGTVTSVNTDDFTIGVPELLGDPDGAAVEYGPRTLVIPVLIEGSADQALAVQSQVAREVLRRQNWLRVQLHASSEPVWFRTMRSQPGDLELTDVRADDLAGNDLWRIAVTLEAEAFAYGERVVLTSVAVSNDPTATSGCRVQLPAILGDGPAPLRVRARVSGSQVQSTQQGMVGSRWMLATAAFPTRRGRVLSDANTYTLAANAGSTKESNAVYSGGNGVRVTVPTGTASARCSSSLTLPHGRWRVLLRAVRRTAGAATAGAFVEFGSGAGAVRTRQVPLWKAGVGDVQASWFDLGSLQTPLRTVVPDDLLASPASSVAVALHLLPTGQGDIGLDALMLIPADDAGDGRGAVMLTEFADPAPTTSSSATSGDRTFFDGDAESVFRQPQISASQWGSPDTLASATAGVFVAAHPGLENDLYLMHHVRDATTTPVPVTGDVLTASTEVVVSYHPRWLWLGGG